MNSLKPGPKLVEQVDRLIDLMRQIGTDWIVLTSPESVCYATGHVVPLETGPSPFAGGPSLVLVGRDGVVGIVLPVQDLVDDLRVDMYESYYGFAYERDNDQVRSYQRAVSALAQRLGVGGKIGFEAASFPASLNQLLAGSLVPCDAQLARARARKTAFELGRLQHAAEVAAIGQQAAMAAIRPGKSELEIFSEVRRAMEAHQGKRCEVAGDVLSGIPRTASCSGWPTNRIIERGDPVVFDLAPRVNGFWGDSCNSFVVGEPTKVYLRLFNAAHSALQLAEAIIRPGLAISELDRRLRGEVGRYGYHYPHHSGHSIGTSVHEFPRVVPFEDTLLEQDMVLMIEPGAYDQQFGGVRLETMFRVTASGARKMHDFEMCPARSS